MRTENDLKSEFLAKRIGDELEKFDNTTALHVITATLAALIVGLAGDADDDRYEMFDGVCEILGQMVQKLSPEAATIKNWPSSH